MNLSPSALSVSLEFKEDTLAIERLTFLNYSGFKSLESRIHTAYFVNDFTNKIIDSVPRINIQPRHTYSFYLVNHNGVPLGGYEILDQ